MLETRTHSHTVTQTHRQVDRSREVRR
jgi:hypothetical protein